MVGVGQNDYVVDIIILSKFEWEYVMRMNWEIGVDEREREEEIERKSEKRKKGVKSWLVFSCVLPRSSSKNKVFFVNP